MHRQSLWLSANYPNNTSSEYLVKYKVKCIYYSRTNEDGSIIINKGGKRLLNSYFAENKQNFYALF